MKSILVIGMGRFGTYLAKKLSDLGNQVMIVDKDEELINRLSPHFVDAMIGDCSREEVLEEIGVDNFDICFVTMGKSFQPSLEVTALLKDMGAKHVVSVSGSEIQSKFLLRNGADEVIYPQMDMAIKAAVKYNADNIFDFIKLGADYGVFEVKVPGEWVGKDVVSADIRRAYNLNVLAVKKGDSSAVFAPTDYIFESGDHVIVAGAFKAVERLKG
ncbi:MAG TPA: TrkA family potassium uptake protein [Candidatus Limadaptatus stercoripullorum]|uniref:TrkA family potassium uptake protein n=1 Tax=Candidatus Limadaptatus stercoripullorum TaxID=2840846 RepID=A0A9D1NB91_9FIRM|nr:TrkA family potassium uptake protein [Candidatus Limadaptatus stercoripullorum]